MLVDQEKISYPETDAVTSAKEVDSNSTPKDLLGSDGNLDAYLKESNPVDSIGLNYDDDDGETICELADVEPVNLSENSKS